MFTGSRIKFYNKYEALRQRLVRPNAVFKGVELLSYHVPKTAGTSLYLALEDAYGAEKIKRVYHPAEAKTMSMGAPFWVWPSTDVIHGHIRPHAMHKAQFPNAKRIIWVRDPVLRCYSFVRHWMKMRTGSQYLAFEAKHIKTGSETAIDLFEKLINDPEFDHVRLFYQHFFQGVSAGHFTFIGVSERFEEELKRLEIVLQKPLNLHVANTNIPEKTHEFNAEMYREHFASEYAYLRDVFGIAYR